MELRSQDDFCIFALMLCHGLLTMCRTTFWIGTAASRLLFVAVGFWINYIAFCKSTLATGASKLLHRDSLVQCYICLRSSMVFGTPLPADRGRVAAYRVCRGCLRICFLFFHLPILSSLKAGRWPRAITKMCQLRRKWNSIVKTEKVWFWVDYCDLYTRNEVRSSKNGERCDFELPRSGSPAAGPPAQEELLMVAALVKITLDDGWPESSKEQVTQVYVKKIWNQYVEIRYKL